MSRRKPPQGQLALLNSAGVLQRTPEGHIIKGQHLPWDTREKIRQATTGKQKGGQNVQGSDNFRSREFTIVSPDGQIHKARGIRAFAQEHGLDENCLRAVIIGKTISHKGWRLPEPRASKTKTVPQEQVDEYIRLYESGYTLKDIAIKFGFRSPNSIKQQLLKAGFDGFRRDGDISPRNAERRELKLQQYIRLYESGLTVQQIADKLGMDVSVVYSTMKRHGYTGFRTIEESRALTLQDRNNQIKAAYSMGLKPIEIGSRFGLTAGSVRRILKQMGVESRPMGYHIAKPGQALKYWELYKRGWSVPKIAKKFGVAPNSVYRMLHQYGYKVRSNSEAQKLKSVLERQ